MRSILFIEEELEVRLWIRTGRKIILTDSGKLLLKRAPQLMETVKAFREGLNSEVQGPQPIRIGTFEVFSTYFLSFLNTLHWDYQKLELHELLPGMIEKYVSLGELDIGITYLPVPHAELDFLKVLSIEMGVYARQGAFASVAQRDLPFVIPANPLQGVPTRVRGLDGWPDNAYQRKVIHRVTLLESALELCRQGRAAGYFPTFIAQEHNKRVREELQLVRQKTPYPGRVCKADVYIVKRKSFEETKTIKQLAKALRVVCGGV